MKTREGKRGKELDAYRRGVAAYDRGDWMVAGRLLREAMQGEGSKEDRVHAEGLLGALSRDWFSLGIAAALLAGFCVVIAWKLL